MSRTCFKHPTLPSQTRCFQCRRGVCTACVRLTPGGSFCSTECQILYDQSGGRVVHEKNRRANRMRAIALLMLLGVSFFIGLHLLASGNESLRKYDLLGTFIGYSEPSSETEP